MNQIAQTNQYYNPKLIRNNRIFASCLFYFQTATIILYAFFILPTPTKTNNHQQLFITTGITILTIIGFGLIFTTVKNNQWASIGFTLLIVAISYQMFFIVSGFWNMVGISGNQTVNWGGKINVKLSNSDDLLNDSYGFTAVEGLKCSLANVIAFAAVLGRAGPLQAFIIAVFGTFMYELNHRLVTRLAFDFGGSMSIFSFAGFYGAAISTILYCKQKETVKNHPFHKAVKFSFATAGIGSLFCWVFFPWLNIDIPASLVYNYQGAINTIYCISSCVITCVGVSCIIHGKLNFKDFVYSPIVGGVIIGSSSALISNSLGAILMGVAAGTFHLIFQRLQMKIRPYLLIQNNVFFLYGIQGLFGGFLSSIFINIDSTSYTQRYTMTNSQYFLPSYQGQLQASAISAGIGLISGLLLSPLILLVNGQTIYDHYHIRSYWIVNTDGISEIVDVQMNEKEVEGTSQPDTEYYKQVLIKEGEMVKNRFAFL